MAKSSVYARFVYPGTDPLWSRALFWVLLVVTVVAYAYDCYLSGRFLGLRRGV